MINAFEVEEALPFAVYESASERDGSPDGEEAVVAAAAMDDAASTDRTLSDADSEGGVKRRPAKRVKRCAGRAETLRQHGAAQTLTHRAFLQRSPPVSAIRHVKYFMITSVTVL